MKKFIKKYNKLFVGLAIAFTFAITLLSTLPTKVYAAEIGNENVDTNYYEGSYFDPNTYVKNIYCNTNAPHNYILDLAREYDRIYNNSQGFYEIPIIDYEQYQNQNVTSVFKLQLFYLNKDFANVEYGLDDDIFYVALVSDQVEPQLDGWPFIVYCSIDTRRIGLPVNAQGWHLEHLVVDNSKGFQNGFRFTPELDSLSGVVLETTSEHFKTLFSSTPIEKVSNSNEIYDKGYDKGVSDTKNINGIWKYISNVRVETNDAFDFNFDTLVQNGYINGYVIDLYSLGILANDDYGELYIFIEFNNAPITEFDLWFKGNHNYVINVLDEELYTSTFNIDSEGVRLTYNDLVSKNNNFGNYVYAISINATSPDSLGSILNNSSYAEGFQVGFNNGLITGNKQGYDEGFANGLEDKDNNQSYYNEGYDKGNADGYLKGFNDGEVAGADTSNSLSNMVKSVVVAPFDIFKSIFSFEILGINLSGLIFSGITLLVVIWLVKKFI